MEMWKCGNVKMWKYENVKVKTMICLPPIITLPEATSSNTIAMSMAREESIQEGTIINVLHQTQGKGQGNHLWHSLASQNLTFSMILYPEFLSVSEQFMLSKTIAVAIASFVNSSIDNVYIKWPNDIYVNEKKISGILIENLITGNKISCSIIGIGININQVAFPKEIQNPTSLSLETKKEYNVNTLLLSLQKKLLHWYSLLKQEKYKIISTSYHKRLLGKNEIGYFLKNDSLFEAKLLCVDDKGFLHLNVHGKEQMYAVGEILYESKKKK